MADPQAVSETGNITIDALLTGYKWDTGNLTYSFPSSGWWYVVEQVFDDFLDDIGVTDLIPILETFVDLLTEPEATVINFLQELLLPFADPVIIAAIANNGFQQFNAAQQVAATYATQQFASVANVSFTLVNEGSFHVNPNPFADDFGIGFTHGVIRFGETASTSAPAFGIPPLEAVEILLGNGFLGDTWFDNDGRFDMPVLGSFAHFTIMHELGHAMGLKHGHESGLFGTNIPEWLGGALTGVDGPLLPVDRNSIQFSIMTYRSALNGADSLVAGANNYAQSLMMLDIQALQYMYGADFSTNAGNTTYSWDPATGEMKIDGVSNGTPGANIVFLTVWDGNGIDTYDMSAYSNGVNVDLEPGKWSITSQGQRANLGGSGVDQFALGTVYNALLYQGNTQSLIENANGGSGNDTMNGNGAANLLRGNGGSDTLVGFLGADTLEGGDGNDSLDGGIDNDSLSGGIGNDTLNGAEGDDTFDGGGDNDTISGGSGNDTANGGDGNDTINGGTGDDEMAGGNGDDLFLVDTDGDEVIENENGGTDTIRTALSSIILADNVENLDYTGIGPLAVMGNDSNNSIGGGINNDTISGQGGNDTLLGNNGHDLISGDNGDDQVFGGAGNDLLDGGADNDLVEGGSGDDQVSGGIGNDTLRGGANNDYVDGGDGTDQVSGDEGNDQVSGGAGNDTVWGGGGNDLTDGGTGDDVIVGEAGDDQVSAGDGNDFASGGANNDYVDGGLGNDTVNGDEGNDQISGGEGDDSVTAGTGHDQADGGGGNDSVTGDEGDDYVTGGAGNDTVSGGTGNDNVDGGDGNDIVAAGEGDDTATGGAGLDTITAGDGNDSISAGSGNDDITGGAGNDTVSAGDGDDLIREGGGGDNIDGGAGIDTVDYSASTVGIVFSPMAQGLYGDALGDQLLNVEILYGTSSADVLYLDTADNTIYGLGGNDKLYGLAGNDWLDGGTGADTMTGATEDDVYIVDNAGDVVVELINEGRDRVETTLTSYLLGLYVDDLTFTGAGNFLGTGNSLDNSIVGGAGADVLKGEGGNDTLVGLGGVDTMWGGIGNDHYYVDDANDKVNEGKFDGTDSVFSSVTFTLSTYVENLTLLGGASINGFGNTIGNEIIGNAAANKLYGDFGNDTLTGNGGADEFIFNTSLNGTNNVDFITDFAVVDDTIVLDKAVFKALTAGALAAAAFHIGAGPADMSDRIIYDDATGNLYYDANGSAGGSSSGNGTQFAKLAAGLALTSADFLVV